MALNDRQQRFAEEYLVDLNGRRAAIRAGYASNSAEVQASQLLRNPKVAAEVDRLMAERAGRVRISQDHVVLELIPLVMSNMADYAEATEGGAARLKLGELDRRGWGAIHEITVEETTEGKGEAAVDVRKTKIKLYDKRAAAELLGRHLGMWIDKLEHTGKDGQPLGFRMFAPGAKPE